MVCAVGDESGKIFEQISIPTKTPEETMPEIIEYFAKAKIEALESDVLGRLTLIKVQLPMVILQVRQSLHGRILILQVRLRRRLDVRWVLTQM